MKIRKIRDQLERVETGATQFGNDWPGLFIRGDDAMCVLKAINAITDGDRRELVPLLVLAEIIEEDVIVSRNTSVLPPAPA